VTKESPVSGCCDESANYFNSPWTIKGSVESADYKNSPWTVKGSVHNTNLRTAKESTDHVKRV